MFSFISGKNSLVHTILLLALLSGTWLAVQTSMISNEDLKDNLQNIFHTKHFCLHSPHSLAAIVYTTLLGISLLLSFILLAHYVLVKEMVRSPGNILAVISIGHVLATINQIALSYHCLHQNNHKSHGTDSSNFDFFGIGVEHLINFYQISFCTFNLLALKTALKGPNMPTFCYHLFPLILATTCTYVAYLLRSFKAEIFCICGFNLTSDVLLPMLKYGGLVAIILEFGKHMKNSIPQCEKISHVKMEFLNYYSKYYICLRYIYVGRGFIEVTTSILMRRDLDDQTSKALNIILIASHIFTGTLPIILTLVRLSDPTIVSYWRQKSFTNWLKEETSNETFDHAMEKKKSFGHSLSGSLEKELKRKPYIFQIQHGRKIQVVYSILSGIHYFWHVRKTKRVDECCDKKQVSEDPVLENIADEKHIIKDFETKQSFNIKRRALQKEVPHILQEIIKSGYNFAQGKFSVYAPKAFREIIELDNSNSAITESLSLKENLSKIAKSGLNNAGKSGEFFFFSKDNNFIIKTVSKTEFKLLMKILPQYVNYLKLNPDSLIAKIYGLFSFRVGHSYEKYYYILMKNLNDCPNDCTSRKYDLKGSTVGRRVVKNEDVNLSDLSNFGTLKDLDFDKFEKKINVKNQVKSKLLKTLKSDAEFLSSLGLLDYSLILYVVEKKECVGKDGLSELQNNIPSKNSPDQDSKDSLSTFIESADGKLYYKVGIIDYLTKFGPKKRLEIWLKKLLAFNPNYNISAQPPKIYAERFVSYLEKSLE